MNRLDFFRAAVASVITAVAVRLGISDPDVPRAVDCRKGTCTVPVRIYRHGRELRHVVAYDLDRDEAVEYRLDPRGHVYLLDGDIATETLSGGIVVRWANPTRAA